MSLWDSLRGVLGAKPGVSGRESGRSCVVDGEKLLEGRGGGPVERVQTLQRLAQFVEREQVKLQVVFAGRPLREVANGGAFGTIKVYFSEQASGISEQIQTLARDAGRGVLVVTSDKNLEETMQAEGHSTMRVSTLRKALDPNQGGEHGGGGGRRDHGRRRDRGPRRDRRGGPGGGGQQGGPGGEHDQSQDSGGTEGGDQAAGESDSNRGHREKSQPGNQTTVKNLIDLVE